MEKEQPQLNYQVGPEDFEPKQKFYLIRITGMHELYGRTPDKTCKTCIHCRPMDFKKLYYQCELCKQAHSTDVSWHIDWLACGKYEE